MAALVSLTSQAHHPLVPAFALVLHAHDADWAASSGAFLDLPEIMALSAIPETVVYTITRWADHSARRHKPDFKLLAS